MYKFQSSAKSDIKGQIANEDSFYANDNRGFYIVADGMKGKNGKLASETIVNNISKYAQKGIFNKLSVENLENAVQKVNDDLLELSSTQGSTQSTLDMVWFNKIFVNFYHVGDSRIYGLNLDNDLVQITDDEVKYKRMIKDEPYSLSQMGVKESEILINKFNRGKDYFHSDLDVPYRGLGMPNLGRVFLHSEPIQNYSKIILLTDGISDIVQDYELRNILVGSDNSQTAINNILERVDEANGAVNLNLKYNNNLVYEIYSDLFEDHRDKFDFVSVISNEKTRSAKFKKLIQCIDSDSKVHDLFYNAVKNELEPRDNSTIIVVDIEKDDSKRWFK